MKKHFGGVIGMVLLTGWMATNSVAESFTGQFYSGEGNAEYVRMLDTARRMYASDPEFQNMAMLYLPLWNGLVEGPTWGAWWVQNSYGTTYCALPFYEEPFVTFLQNSQDLWFNKMGDGKTSYVWNGKDSWVPPDGCLMDCASDIWAMHRQGDGRVNIHDWGVEFTAAGALLQSELLLISRDPEALARYLPKLERCARFIETRRDPRNNLFLAGPAGNLLAPSFAGYKKPDGTYGMAYLTGLSVTHIAFLDRLIELEKLAGRTAAARSYAELRASARKGLELLTTPEGYLVKSMDPDGTRHGVFGAAKYGYFEASPNHDAICFRVVEETQARQIYRQLAAIPGLRPYGLIAANSPSLDDMYEAPQGLWGFGTWVNGGHWTTCEARIMMAYYRVGQYADALKSMQQIMTFARKFRMDNPLVKFGSEVYQPGEPINLTYDAFGAPAGFIRGLFEYLYNAEGLTLVPHLPDGITRLEQKFPIRFGTKRLYLAVAGQGPITAVLVNGKPWASFYAKSVVLPYEATPEVAAIQILMGEASAKPFRAPEPDTTIPSAPALADWRQPEPANVINATDLPLRIGADSNGGSRFAGDIARACLFNRALSAGQIAAISQAEASPLLSDPALVGNWDFARLTNGVFANRSGQAPSARITGQVETVESPFGKAIHLSGQGCLEISNAPALNLAKGGTWYALIRPATTNGRLIDKCPVGGATGYTFDTHPGNALRLITDAGAISFEAKLVPGQWAHVAATVDTNGSSALYLNGRLVTASKRQVDNLDLAALLSKVDRIQRFHKEMTQAGLAHTYEAAHARLAAGYLGVTHRRLELIASGQLARLPQRSQAAADRLYLSTTAKLCEGLAKVLDNYKNAADSRKKQVYELWLTSGK